jgi:hypothetical protein
VYRTLKSSGVLLSGCLKLSPYPEGEHGAKFLVTVREKVNSFQYFYIINYFKFVNFIYSDSNYFRKNKNVKLSKKDEMTSETLLIWRRALLVSVRLFI